MPSIKTRNPDGTGCEETVYMNNGSYVTGSGNFPRGDLVMNSADTACLPDNFNQAEYGIDDEVNEDADEVNNDSDTSTSFSLQECMNEFRARRIRRTSVHQRRQEVDKNSVSNFKNEQGTTELDVIKQNLCNKEQERKCKPCQNGFCYCFTSDSGDGYGGNFSGCASPAVIPSRNARRGKRTECIQPSHSARRTAKSPRSKEIGNSHVRKCSPSKTTSLKGTTKATNILKAISSLETSKREDPLIRIIQELRDNCVISTVKVNKYKMQAFGEKHFSNERIIHNSQRKNSSNDREKTRETDFISRQSFDTAPCKYTPTAPILEQDVCLETVKNSKNVLSSSLETNKKSSDCSEERFIAGGQLLHKRISISKLNYKPKYISRAPPKPPRTSLSSNKYCSSTASTSSSMRQAEQVVDDFLAKKCITIGCTTNNPKSIKETEHSKKSEKAKTDLHPLTPNKNKKQNEQTFSIYPSPGDVGSFIESKELPLSKQNSNPAINNVKNVINIGWNEAKIKDMLTYDANKEQRDFHFNSSHAQPQRIVSNAIVGDEKFIGWQIAPKVNLDTVDGIVHHNLALNLEHKNTPVKTKLISSSEKTKDGSRRQSFLWSEQLRHLSPWSNKIKLNDTNENKQHLHSSSKAFIISSKKKLMRLVSPKKENRDQNKIQLCNVGIQTSCNDISHCQSNMNSQYQDGSSSQSIPGSYHSPMQSLHTQYTSSTQSQNTTPNGTESQFDFSRTVHSPPKKTPRSIQRKLNFPICTFTCKENAAQNSDNQEKTYRSFNSELDQDVSLSKLNYILSNIRSKLETSDQQAVRTFLETKSVVNHNSFGLDCPDNHHKKQIEKNIELHKSSRLSTMKRDQLNEPIYSEIEDHSVYISEAPDFHNHTAVQHFVAADNPDILYAKVNKSIVGGKRTQLQDLKPQIPLAKIIQDSLKSKKIITNIAPLPTLAEPPGSESTSYSLPSSSTLSLSHYQPLNNVRVMEHNSSPKKQQNLNKSDLSLHRSEFFLDNLCKSELIVETSLERKNLEKVQNGNENIPNIISINEPSPNDVFCMPPESDQDLTHSDIVSYELPNDDVVDGFNELVDVDNSTVACNNLGLSTIIPPSSRNQSTPKSFVAKDKSVTCELNIDAKKKDISDHSYNSCPNTPHKQSDICIINQRKPSHSLSMNEVSKCESMEKSNVETVNALQRYKSFKNLLRKSYRKSKSFIRNEGKRWSTSMNLSINNPAVSSTLAPGKQSPTVSNHNLDVLLSLNEAATVSEQIAQTVIICRKLPDLEISMEMVEAERLLLFSTLCRENHGQLLSTAKRKHSMTQNPTMRFFIDDMFLPVLSDVNVDIFFNYFYIITFECGGVIKSTQSAECINNTAVFRDNDIEFVYFPELKADTLLEVNQNAVKCNIFMLRLRKISTALIEPKKKTLNQNLTPCSTLKSISQSTSSSSLDEIVSRFRLHASFTLDAKDFVPYEYVHQESDSSDQICIRTSSFCTLPLKALTKSTNLSGHIRLKARAEVRVLKHVFGGFLNVQDPHKQHNWNQRWCTLDGIFLYVWLDKNSLNASPLITIDLRDSKHNINCPLTCSPREICARPRSFCLEWKTATVFFAADTQESVDDWLKSLNVMMDFIATWL